MQIQTAMSSYLSLIGITKKTNQQRVMLGKANQHAGEDINVCASAAEISMEVPQEAKSRLLPYDLGISLLGMHLTNSKSAQHRDTAKLTAPFKRVEIQKQLSINNRLVDKENAACKHRECYSAI